MDIFSSDLLMSLFASAVHNYKHDSLVRPFPPVCIKDSNEKDFDLLVSVIDDVPPFHEIDWKDTTKINEKSLKLIKWVINPKRFKLKKSLPQKFEKIKELCGETEDLSIAKPDYLFEVDYADQEEAKFKRICGDRSIIYAYHGSRAENFHSILHNGLRNNLTKMALYGEGIYLSSDLRICQTYSPATGVGWKKSLFGSSLSCIAVCQVVDHPDVKCSVKTSSHSLSELNNAESSNDDSQLRQRSTNEGSSNTTDAQSKTEVKTTVTERSRSFIQGSEGGKVPDKYYVVRNDDLVRVKYLFLYAPNAQKELINEILTGTKMKPKPKAGVLVQFYRRHKFFLVMLAYALLLVFVSLWNSKVFSKWWQNFLKNAEDDQSFLHEE